MTKDKLKALSDEALWNQLRSSDIESVNTLFRRHYRVLYSYGIKISRDESLTKDCIQEVFVELWQKKETLPEVAHVKAYILKILRRRILNGLNRAEKQYAHELAYSQEFDVALSHEDLVIEEQLSLDVQARLNRALQKLTPRQREVIYLRFFDGLNCESISEITSLKYQSVINLIHEAIKHLREHVVFTASLLISFLESFY